MSNETLVDRISRLEKRIEKLEQDGKRLDWLVMLLRGRGV